MDENFDKCDPIRQKIVVFLGSFERQKKRIWDQQSTIHIGVVTNCGNFGNCGLFGQKYIIGVINKCGNFENCDLFARKCVSTGFENRK